MIITFRFRFVLLGVIAAMLSSCNSVEHKYTELKSYNSSFRVKSLVMHFTAVDYADSLKFLVNEGGSVSSHYLIPAKNDPSYPYGDVKIMQLVDESERAWHAGQSYWQGRSGLNDTSIGIEIVNQPECIEQETNKGYFKPRPFCIYSDYEDEQIDLLIALSKDILDRNPDISPTAIVGHSDIAPSRKHDPGPRFPWKKLYDAGIGAWYDTDTVNHYHQLFSQVKPHVGLIQRTLSIYGYKIELSGQIDRQTSDVLGAFQMHFLPWQVNYQNDINTAATLFALIEKYFPHTLESLMSEYQQFAQQDPKSIAENNAEKLNVKDKQHSQLTMQVDLINSKVSTNKSVNRYSFYATSGDTLMQISSYGVSAADIYINEQKLQLGDYFSKTISQEHSASFSISKRSRYGHNLLRVDNVKYDDKLASDNQAFLHIGVNYPAISALDKPQKSYDFSALDALIQTDVRNGFPGANLLVLHKGKVIKHSAYGAARLYDDGSTAMKKPELMSKNTIFDLASLSKVFATTLAIIRLVDEEKIDLHAPVANYLPEYNKDGRKWRSIADLLSHASGYNSEVQLFKSDNALGEHVFSQNKSLSEQILLKELPFSASKRSTQLYSDTNFMILGVLVERVSGLPLDEYLETQIYAGLGLENTKFNPLQKGFTPAQFAATEIQGNTRGARVEFENVRDYVLQGEVHDEKAFYSMQGVSGHAGLFSNARELAVLSQLLLNGGGYDNQFLFSQQTLNRFVHPEFVKDSIGLGWRLSAPDSQWIFGPYASARAFGHTGWTGTAVVIDPELDLAIIYLTNKRHSPVIEENGRLLFFADRYASAKYSNVMSLAYEAIIGHKTNKN